MDEAVEQAVEPAMRTGVIGEEIRIVASGPGAPCQKFQTWIRRMNDLRGCDPNIAMPLPRDSA